MIEKGRVEMKIGRKCKMWNAKRKFLTMILSVVLICGIGFGISLIVQAASAPKAWIASYADGRTSGLRVSEMLEVKTSGFSENAILSYEYKWSNSKAYFAVEPMYSPDTAYYSRAYGDLRYAAISGSKAQKHKLTVVVKDTNPQSSTYNKTATATYSKFKASNLSKDISARAYGMFVGEEETLLTLLGRGGILHITCGNSKTKDCDLESGNSVKLSGSGNDTTIKAISVGESRCEISVKKEKGCSYHSGQSGEGEIIIYVFGKPIAEARYSDSIALTNTEKGVTYTINGVSKTCTQNGQELVFTGLKSGTNYSITCSKVIDGKKVTSSFAKKTNNKAWVYFNNNKKGNTTPPTQELYAGGLVETPTTNVPEVPGFYIEGWYQNIAGSGRAWNFATNKVAKTMTLYANWKDVPNTLSITLKKDDAVWTGQKIELYANLEKAYELTEENGVYVNDEIINGTYEVYVNGENIYRPVTFATTATTKDGGEEENRVLEYYSVEIDTSLNDAHSAEPGTMELRQGNRVWNVFPNEDGKIEAYALKDGDGTSGSTYDIYIGDVKVRDKINATASTRLDLHFYKVELALTHDTAWTTANVTLRDELGMAKHTLNYEETEGNTAYYRAILQADEHGTTDTYDVYVRNQNTHEVVSLAQGDVSASDYKKSARFYVAEVTVRTDDAADNLTRVTVNNGIDTTQLLDLDHDGIYTENVLTNISNGTELTYSVYVKGVIDENPVQLTMENSEVQIDFYNVHCHITLGGREIVNTLKVRKGTYMSSPSSPVNNGRNIEGWYKEASFENLYDFAQPVMIKTDIYGKYEGQKAEINGYIKTDENGTLSSTGIYYRMSNLTIGGFPNGDVMTGFVLETTGSTKITIKPDDALGAITILPDNALDGNVVAISEGIIVVQFANEITMKEMQTFLRNNVIVQPDSAVEHTMQVTVYGTTD